MDHHGCRPPSFGGGRYNEHSAGESWRAWLPHRLAYRQRDASGELHMTGLLMLVAACGHVCHDKPQAVSYTFTASADVLFPIYFADPEAPTTAECAQFCQLINDGTARCTVVLPEGHTADNIDSAGDADAAVNCSGFVYTSCR